MVDVSRKLLAECRAETSAWVAMNPQVLDPALPGNRKGNPFKGARIAGKQAAKRTSELIPMCHGVAPRFVDISYFLCEDEITLCSRASTTSETRVEREALTALSVAALTFLTCARFQIRAS